MTRSERGDPATERAVLADMKRATERAALADMKRATERALASEGGLS